VGEYCTVSVMLWDGESVTADAPDSDKFTPVKAALEIDTFALPVFVMVTLRAALLPTFTFPKLMLDGFTASFKPAATPVPLSAIAEDGLDASLTSEKLPLEGPADFGPNCTLKVAVLPALNIIGRTRPEVLKPAPEIFA